jgi:hypothetical protein
MAKFREGGRKMTTIKTTIRNGRIDVPAPSEMPDGTHVLLTIAESDDDVLLTREEVIHILAAMERLKPWDLPTETASELEEWERRINQRGLEHRDPSMEDAFQ